uniref:Uncharacterized protein n=1 Tax=Alexandrium catenella TaxID=2925 RepID=A0A7S1WN14_ALECA
MQECLRWEEAEPSAHLLELAACGEFNCFISEYFDPPEPVSHVLSALALLMGWAGDTKQIVTHITGMHHADDDGHPEHFEEFLGRLRERTLSELQASDRERFRQEMTHWLSWPKFDSVREEYAEGAPLNSYDVLKCSQACFHLYEWLRSLLPGDERPPRCTEIDLEAFRLRKAELQRSGLAISE